MERVKLFVGMITGKEELFDAAKEACIKDFNRVVDYISPIIPFDFTSYYEKEFGKSLLRKFVSFNELIYPDELVKIKHMTKKIESEFAEEGRRRINLDPGYLSFSKLVLASSKDSSWRVYLGEGVYAEVTLRFIDGKFQPLPYTYPDYRTEAYLQIFHEIRKIYKSQCKLRV